MKKLWSARNLVEGYREPCLLGVPVRVCGPAVLVWIGATSLPPFNQHKTEHPEGGHKTQFRVWKNFPKVELADEPVSQPARGSEDALKLGVPNGV